MKVLCLEDSFHIPCLYRIHNVYVIEFQSFKKKILYQVSSVFFFFFFHGPESHKDLMDNHNYCYNCINNHVKRYHPYKDCEDLER